MGVFTVAGRNEMLDASLIALVGLFNGDPEAAGTEISGGSPAYARQSIVMTAASGGQIQVTDDVVFNVGSGSTINYVAFYNAAGTVLLGKDSVAEETFASQGTYTLDTATFIIAA